MSFKEKFTQNKELVVTASQQPVQTNVGKGLLMVVGLILFGLAVGWFVLGWWIAPVQWESQSMNDMPQHSKEIVVTTLSENYALTQDPTKVDPYTYELYNLDEIACKLAMEADTQIEMARLINIAYLVNGYGCK